MKKILLIKMIGFYITVFSFHSLTCYKYIIHNKTDRKIAIEGTGINGPIIIFPGKAQEIKNQQGLCLKDIIITAGRLSITDKPATRYGRCYNKTWDVVINKEGNLDLRDHKK